jgi:ABC-type branched-subunit amino acid transport system ATPase component/ABC-type branched-subunit amino acid transport system permease subunit
LGTGGVGVVSIPFPVVVLGLVSGMSYGILAVGLVLVYRTSRLLNFAHGEVGAFAAAVLGVWVVQIDIPYWLAFPVVVAIGAGTSMLIEVVAIRRLRRAPKVMSIVATLGAGAFLFALSFAVNSQVRRGSSYPQPPGLPTLHVGALTITPAYSAILLVTPLIVVGLAAFLRWTKFGVAIRAAADNPEAASLGGIATSRMSLLAWAIAGAIAAYTAILQFPSIGFVTVGQSLGPSLLVRALVCGVIARMVNLPVALAAGLGVGVVEQVLLWNNPSGGTVEAILFAALMVALLLQTRGVTSREEEKGSWLAVQASRPLPDALQRIWAVRNLGRLAVIPVGILFVAVLFTTNAAALKFSGIVGYTIVALSVYVVTGLSGQLSLGQFALAGIGAVMAHHLIGRGAGFPTAFLLAGFGTAVVSVIVGLPALRLKGLMLAVATLGFAQATQQWLLQRDWAFGAGVETDHPVFGSHALTTARAYYLFALPFLGIAFYVAWNVRRGGVGRWLMSVRDNEDGARAFSVRATRVKLQSFAIAGFLAGIGGAVYANSLARVSSNTFAPIQSIQLVAVAAIGGLSVLSGSLLGALYIYALPAFVPLDAAGLAASSLGWLLLVLYVPGGIAQAIEPVRSRIVNALARRHGIDLAADDDAPPVVATLGPPIAAPASPNGSPLLEVTRVAKRYGGVVAVDDVSFKVIAGETVGVIGPNGAGKTTLFEIVSGFVAPDAGTVRFAGHDVTSVPPEVRTTRGMVRSFQDARLFPTMTVTEVVQLAFEREEPTRFLASMLGFPDAVSEDRRKRARADELVQMMGLAPYRNKQISELSTGTRRITELACVLALEPRLLLLDEPSSGVAQRETEALGELLATIKGYLGTTFVVIEHDMPLIMGISDRIIAMEAGRVIADNVPSVVQADPLVVESYLGGDVRAIQRSGVT